LCPDKRRWEREEKNNNNNRKEKKEEERKKERTRGSRWELGFTLTKAVVTSAPAGCEHDRKKKNGEE